MVAAVVVVAVVVPVAVVGAVVVGAPFATLSVTVEPFASRCPAGGASSTTVPAGSVEVTCVCVELRPRASSFATAWSTFRPFTSGTATFGAPLSITSVTCVPFRTSVASCGFCETTTLVGFFVGR